MLATLLLIALAYLLGSIPTGYLVAKARGIDIFTMGSGSTGATNVWRCVGKKEGIFVLLADLGKGYLPVLLTSYLEHGPLQANMQIGLSDLPPVLVALAALIGHSKSIFLKGKGGKSAATGLGTILALNAAVGGLTFAVWIIIVLATRIVSLASISAGVAVSIFMFALNCPAPYLGYAIAAGLYVIVRHKANIQRLLKGEEAKLGTKAK
jgi:glycerol-3-phosphate acyltransferase PlsY